ncbi:MAG: hypothetical protein M3367_17995 [Acidobacteriota bacterium]|nr:hypothetical protein [Acidobacteriota bacterium]
MKKLKTIKVIKRHSVERQAVAETLAEPVAAPKNERGLVETVKDWVREHQRRKRQTEQSARRLFDGFAPTADEI